MRETMLRGWRSFVAINDRFAEVIGRGLSFSLWLTVLTIGSGIWLAINHLVRPFDPNDNTLILILTIITGLDACATKLMQLGQRRADLKREDALAQIIEKIRDVSIDTSAIAIEIRGILDKSEPRDLAIHTLLEQIADALELRGGDPSEH